MIKKIIISIMVLFMLSATANAATNVVHIDCEPNQISNGGKFGPTSHNCNKIELIDYERPHKSSAWRLSSTIHKNPDKKEIVMHEVRNGPKFGIHSCSDCEKPVVEVQRVEKIQTGWKAGNSITRFVTSCFK